MLQISSMNTNLNLIKAVLFDLDGVLIDATEWHYEALNRALGLFGFTITREDHIEKYNGLPTKIKLGMMKDLPEALHPIINKLKAEYTMRLIELHCRPAYEKILMLKHLKFQGLKIACCSNATTESVNEMLKRAGLINYFDVIYGNTSGFKSKPDPEIYIETIKHFGFLPSECLIVEDSPHGIEAAQASGAKVIQVKGYSEVNLSLFD